MDSNLYSWDPGLDHTWISADKTGRLAYMACCLDGAVPDIAIDKRLMSGLDLRIKSLFGGGEGETPFDVFRSIGFYVYDAIRLADGSMAFERIGCPDAPIGCDRLTPSLKAVSKCFSIKSFKFAASPLLPAKDLFATGNADETCVMLVERAIASIRRVGAPHMSLFSWRWPEKGFFERGWLDLHAVMGFTDMENVVATIFEWEPYVGCFSVLLESLSRMMNIRTSLVLDGRELSCNGTARPNPAEVLRTAPTAIRLEKPSGACIVELKLFERTSEYCRYSIRSPRKWYGTVAETIVSSARSSGISVDAQALGRIRLAGVLGNLFNAMSMVLRNLLRRLRNHASLYVF